MLKRLSYTHKINHYLQVRVFKRTYTKKTSGTYLLCVLYRVIEKSLGKFVDERKAELLKDKGRPLEGNVVVAGRTDKGVTGFQQVCSFCMSQPNTIINS